jgi:uncharacterized protein (DUF1919 family)
MATKPKRKPTLPKTSPSNSSSKHQETISDKLTKVLVTIGEVRVQQTHFQKQLEKWTLEQQTESIRVNNKFMELQATDRANGDAVTRVTAQLDKLTEKVISADHTARLTKSEAEIAKIISQTDGIELIRASTDKMNNTIKVQWAVLGLILLVGVYLYGSYHPAVVLP